MLGPKVVAGSLCLLNIHLTYLSKFKINTVTESSGSLGCVRADSTTTEGWFWGCWLGIPHISIFRTLFLGGPDSPARMLQCPACGVKSPLLGRTGQGTGQGPQHSEVSGTRLHFQCDSLLPRPGTPGLLSPESDSCFLPGLGRVTA